MKIEDIKTKKECSKVLTNWRLRTKRIENNFDLKQNLKTQIIVDKLNTRSRDLYDSFKSGQKHKISY